MEWAVVVIIAILVLAPDDDKDKIDICVGNCPITIYRNEGE